MHSEEGKLKLSVSPLGRPASNSRASNYPEISLPREERLGQAGRQADARQKQLYMGAQRDRLNQPV